MGFITSTIILSLVLSDLSLKFSLINASPGYEYDADKDDVVLYSSENFSSKNDPFPALFEKSRVDAKNYASPDVKTEIKDLLYLNEYCNILVQLKGDNQLNFDSSLTVFYGVCTFETGTEEKVAIMLNRSTRKPKTEVNFPLEACNLEEVKNKILLYGKYVIKGFMNLNKEIEAIVMKRLGLTLKQALFLHQLFYNACCGFSLEVATAVVYFMLLAVEHFHRAGYSHRDIKTDSFFLGVRDGKLCLILGNLQGVVSIYGTENPPFLRTTDYASKRSFDVNDQQADIIGVMLSFFELRYGVLVTENSKNYQESIERLQKFDNEFLASTAKEKVVLQIAGKSIVVDDIFTEWYKKLLELKWNEDPTEFLAECKEAFREGRNHNTLINDLSQIFPNYE